MQSNSPINLIESQPRVTLSRNEMRQMLERVLKSHTIEEVAEKTGHSISYLKALQKEVDMLVLIKPDAVEERHVGTIIRIFEQNDFEIIYMEKHSRPPYNKIKAHYAEHEGKDFYPALIKFMQTGPLVAIAFRHRQINTFPAVVLGRKLTMQIREQLGSEGPANKIHCSDSPESATREWAIWFGD